MPSAPAPEPARRTLRLEEPAALRALAHPARQRVVAALYAGGEALTATQAARLCELSPSAMSYHLRALEKWGIVRRGESPDGRERPWLAAADDFTIPPGAYRAVDQAVGSALYQTWTQEIARALDRAGASLGAEDDRTTLVNSRLWLTAAEAREFNAALSALMAPYRGRTSRAHPEDATPLDAYWLLLPADPDALGQPSTPG